MKILPGNIPYKFPGQTESCKPTVNQPSSKKISKSFDEIILSTKAEISSEKFVSDLTNKITKDVCSPCSSKKLEEIKSQIEDGSYHIGVDEIAKKILIG